MAKNINRGPGRPKYEPVIPKSRFTMTDLCEANGVNLKSGKGKNCSRLTLIKFIARDAKRKGHSLIVRLKDTVAEPNSKDGLGRKSFVYQMRSKHDAAKTPRKAKPAAPHVVTQTTVDYESQKAALLAPTPAVVITAPAAPVAPETAPTPAPVAEVKAETETVTAPTAEVPAETAPVATA